jgi:hypothetical protein
LIKFLNEVHRITPRGACWYYGRSWDALASEYTQLLKIISTIPDDPSTVFSGGTRILVSQRSSA